MDLDEKIETHFKLKEFLWLDQWEIFVHPPKKILENLKETATALEAIRAIFNEPIIITSGYRPPKYNKQIGGAQYSAHMEGLAADFYLPNRNCDHVRQALLPELERLEIRMENLKKASWVHIDLRQPGKSGRFFIPWE